MKSFPLLVIAFFLLLGCSKKEEFFSRDYPFVLTTISDVSEDGVTCSAEILDLGKEEIVEYGFVWDIYTKPTISNFHKLYYDKPKKGIYSFDLNYGLVRNETYYVRAYIRTEKSIVYGSEEKFKSMGSQPPVITDFNPKSGRLGTAIIIEGKNFIGTKFGNIVMFDTTKIVVDSAFEDRIYVHQNEVTKKGLVNISVTTAGQTAISEQQFEVLLH